MSTVSFQLARKNHSTRNDFVRLGYGSGAGFRVPKYILRRFFTHLHPVEVFSSILGISAVVSAGDSLGVVEPLLSILKGLNAYATRSTRRFRGRIRRQARHPWLWARPTLGNPLNILVISARFGPLRLLSHLLPGGADETTIDPPPSSSANVHFAEPLAASESCLSPAAAGPRPNLKTMFRTKKPRAPQLHPMLFPQLRHL